LKPYRHSGFQNSGEKIRERFAKADRLEAGGFDPLGGKSTDSRQTVLAKPFSQLAPDLRKAAK
jgi:hypothetical protein